MKRYIFNLDVNKIESLTTDQRLLRIQYKNICLRNFNVVQRNQIITQRLVGYRNSVEHLSFKLCKFSRLEELQNILLIPRRLLSLKFNLCCIRDTDPTVIDFIPLEYLKTLTFKGYDRTMVNVFRRQISVENVQIILKERTWNGVPPEELNEFLLSLPNLKSLRLIGDGTSSYFDHDAFPYALEML